MLYTQAETCRWFYYVYMLITHFHITNVVLYWRPLYILWIGGQSQASNSPVCIFRTDLSYSKSSDSLYPDVRSFISPFRRPFLQWRNHFVSLLRYDANCNALFSAMLTALSTTVNFLVSLTESFAVTLKQMRLGTEVVPLSLTTRTPKSVYRRRKICLLL